MAHIGQTSSDCSPRSGFHAPTHSTPEPLSLGFGRLGNRHTGSSQNNLHNFSLKRGPSKTLASYNPKPIISLHPQVQGPLPIHAGISFVSLPVCS